MGMAVLSSDIDWEFFFFLVERRSSTHYFSSLFASYRNRRTRHEVRGRGRVGRKPALSVLKVVSV